MEDLVERDAELIALERLLREAAAGRGGCALVEGPAGIGKTSLLRAAAATAGERGLRVLHARGAELEQELPYGLVRQLFERWALGLAEPERSRAFDGAAGLAAPVFGLPGESDGLLGADPLFAALHGLYWLVAGLAEEQPLALVIDDVHWADPASVRFVAYLARRLDGMPVAVMLAGRPAEHPFEARVLRPAPLTSRGVEAVVHARLPNAEASFCAACHGATAGNPLYLRELLATGVAAAGDVPALGPAAVATSILERLRRLGPDAERLARAVAVLGPDATLPHAAALAGLDDATHPLDALVAADVLESGRPLRFAHPIARTAVYRALAPGEAERAHRHAARRLAAQGAPPDALAPHLLAVAPAGDPEVVRALTAAADEAMRRGAPDTAACFLARALEEPPPAGERADTVHALGVALLATREPTAFARLEEAIALRDEPQARAAGALELVRAYGMAGMNEDATATVARALDEEPVDRGIAGRLACELAGNGFAVPTALPRGLQRLRALAAGGLPADVEPLVAVTEAAHAIFAGAPDSGESAVLLEHLPAVLGEDRSALVATTLLALVWSDELESARVLGAAAIELAQAAGSEHLQSSVAILTAWAALRAGDLQDALALAEPAHAFVLARREHGDAALIWSLALLTELLVERGELEHADSLLTGVAERPDFLPQAKLLEARGRLRAAQGRWDEARADLLAAGRRAERGGVRNPGVTAWRSGAALALLHAGETERARALAAEEVAHARRFGRAYALGIALRVAGIVRRDDALLAEAVDTLEGSPARLEHAKALCELGAAHRRAGRRTHAREPLLRALDLADRCGARPVARRARDELAAVGARPRRDRITGRDALTASELRVAGLAAEGRTNRDIAQALFLTLRTVETHLTSAYRKLGVSRPELADALTAL